MSSLFICPAVRLLVCVLVSQPLFFVRECFPFFMDFHDLVSQQFWPLTLSQCLQNSNGIYGPGLHSPSCVSTSLSMCAQGPLLLLLPVGQFF